MSIEILPAVDVRYLDSLLLCQGLVQPIFAEQLQEIPHDHLRIWCVQNGVYQIPTWELLTWLEQEINGRSAIEICAGKSCLGRHLGIPMVDNYMHTWPQIRAHYLAMQQTPTDPPSDVEEMDANEAVRQFRPEVVVGAWVTQRWVEGAQDGSVFGPDEHEIIANSAYIHIGNASVHGTKRILLREHRELPLPWLFSRGTDPGLNRVWVWDLLPQE